MSALDNISADVFRIDQLLGAMFDDLMDDPTGDPERIEHWNRAEALVYAARILTKKVVDDLEALPRGPNAPA